MLLVTLFSVSCNVAITHVLISDCIEDMRKEYEASCGLPITDDSQTLLRFCSKLERLLQTGLRGATIFHTVFFVVLLFSCFDVLSLKINQCFFG